MSNGNLKMRILKYKNEKKKDEPFLGNGDRWKCRLSSQPRLNCPCSLWGKISALLLSFLLVYNILFFFPTSWHSVSVIAWIGRGVIPATIIRWKTDGSLWLLHLKNTNLLFLIHVWDNIATSYGCIWFEDSRLRRRFISKNHFKINWSIKHSKLNMIKWTFNAMQ